MAPKSNTWCLAPYTELAIKQFRNGELISAWPCCMMGDYGDWNPLGIDNLSTLTPDEIFNHPAMEQLRQDGLNGVRNPACVVCWDQEDKGMHSFRKYMNESRYGGDHHNGNHKPVYSNHPEELGFYVLDINTSNICNLACRMCSPLSSNLLEKDSKWWLEHGIYTQSVDALNIWRETEEVGIVGTSQWDWLMENTHKVKVLKLAGGEPLYDPNVVSLLQKYIDTGNASDTTLHFHTNATLFSEKNLKILQHFRMNEHVFSIDGCGKIYEYIRYPMTFQKLERSILNYFNSKVQYRSMQNFNFVVSALNVLNIVDFIEWVDGITRKAEKKVTPEIHFSEMFPLNKRGTSLCNLPIELLELSLSRIDAYTHRLQDKNVERMLKNVIISINDAKDNNQCNRETAQKMLNEIKAFDFSRKQLYKDYMDPALSKWLDSIEDDGSMTPVL